MSTASKLSPSTLNAADRNKVGALYIAHFEKLRLLAVDLLGKDHEVDAEDVVHSAFVALLERPALPRGNVGSYLASLIRCACCDRLREIGEAESLDALRDEEEES